MKFLAIFSVLLALSGCKLDYPKVDQQRRAERFDACLKNIPVGPQQTKYNDWAEVIDACSRAAYYQAIIEK